MGVGPSGDINPVCRFVDSDQHSLGNIKTGIDREKQSDFLTRGNINSKSRLPYVLGASAVRGRLSSPEAFVRYGDTGHPEPSLLRLDLASWTDTCLQIYGAISAQNPEFPGEIRRKESLTPNTFAPLTARHAVWKRWPEDVVALQTPVQHGRTSRWDARSRFRPDGKWIQPAALTGLCQPVGRDMPDC